MCVLESMFCDLSPQCYELCSLWKRNTQFFVRCMHCSVYNEQCSKNNVQFYVYLQCFIRCRQFSIWDIYIYIYALFHHFVHCFTWSIRKTLIVHLFTVLRSILHSVFCLYSCVMLNLHVIFSVRYAVYCSIFCMNCCEHCVPSAILVNYRNEMIVLTVKCHIIDIGLIWLTLKCGISILYLSIFTNSANEMWPRRLNVSSGL